eukprot:CAMPEP_0178414240 /NCGR_PEP_ID=MMETSP0689_2-20121128/22936_1 /TAXON_ID=160604 /ORGANISM="Amphidinium massartii, Strain CS-259" /LENGTH=222 /DNA_ID=CAMNT_0020035527 /DNA_START=16 /DNA_END=681 /DNA_ORIENTATION=+
MKRTISHEAQIAAARLRELGFTPTVTLPSSGGADPFTTLGLERGCVTEWTEVRQAFIARIRQYPPDQRPEEFVHILDAYEILKRSWRAPASSDGSQAKRRRIDYQRDAPGVIALDPAGVGHLSAAGAPSSASLPVAATTEAAAAMPAAAPSIPPVPVWNGLSSPPSAGTCGGDTSSLARSTTFRFGAAGGMACGMTGLAVHSPTHLASLQLTTETSLRGNLA